MSKILLTSLALLAIMSACKKQPKVIDMPVETVAVQSTDTVEQKTDSVPPTTETKEKTHLSSDYTSDYDYDEDDEYEQMKKHPEYREGGKYDPNLYWTDYTRDADGERQRRAYIDNDGYDEDDDYDEYYGYDWRQYPRPW